ncbi:hypothetical protein QJS04_geneDACA021520 [Acorus gramineus]|uniref:Uncharacterized protein n=1 Tax=Acorus gramineus TaxID=55184 RepID=A0AAV9A215_ACOGR|nr:hypothetical protein QJS04_geneDACA021520 [Acorus gramineus]
MGAEEPRLTVLGLLNSLAPTANSHPSKESVKWENIWVSSKRSEKVFFRILGWDNPNPSSPHRLGLRLGDVFVAPPSPAAEQPSPSPPPPPVGLSSKAGD